MYQITCKNKRKVYDEPMSLYEISKDFKECIDFEPLAALSNGDLLELNHIAYDDMTLQFIDFTHEIGNKVYKRGVSFLFITAVEQLFSQTLKVRFEHTIDSGLLIKFSREINDSELELIDSRMRELTLEDRVFKQMTVYRGEAYDYFESMKYYDKKDSLDFHNSKFIKLYEFKGFYNYFFGEMPYSSGCLMYFNIERLTKSSIVLSYPTMYDSMHIANTSDKSNVLESFKLNFEYISKLSIVNSSDVNKLVVKQKMKELIRIDESHKDSQVYEIAKNIQKRPKTKVVLVTGPTSSGKTTMASKLSIYLKGCGIDNNVLLLDDYYKNREHIKKDSFGQYDFETIDALDLDLIDRDLRMLLNGQSINKPKYDFKTGSKSLTGEYIDINDKILILVGMHAFDPRLTMGVLDDMKYKIFVNTFAEVNIDNHNLVHTTDLRLLRRIVRDSKIRSISPVETLDMWPNVTLNEINNVNTHIHEADIVFNSSLIYEMGILRLYAEPLLYSIKKTDSGYLKAQYLLNVLESFTCYPSEEVPKSSLLREFIGN